MFEKHIYCPKSFPTLLLFKQNMTNFHYFLIGHSLKNILLFYLYFIELTTVCHKSLDNLSGCSEKFHFYLTFILPFLVTTSSIPSRWYRFLLYFKSSCGQMTKMQLNLATDHSNWFRDRPMGLRLIFPR